MHLSGRNVPLWVEATGKPGKLEQVSPDPRLLEVDEGFEDVVSNVFPNFELEVAELVTGTAARL